MIAYKVVEKGTRFGSNMTINKHVNLNRASFEKLTPDMKRSLKLRMDHKAWFPRYFKGTTVKMAPGSVGILAFDTRENAEEFKADYGALDEYGKIIKVKVKGKLLPKSQIIRSCSEFAHLVGIWRQDMVNPPTGTIFCRAVEVLE